MVLWRERELLETLHYQLEVEQLVLASGRTRWLLQRRPRRGGRAGEDPRDRDPARRRRRRGRRRRRHAAEPEPRRPGRAPSTSPGRTILDEHRDAFVAHQRGDQPARRHQPHLISAGYRPARETLLGLSRRRRPTRPTGPPCRWPRVPAASTGACERERHLLVVQHRAERAALPPGRDGRRQRQHRQRHHRRLRPASRRRRDPGAHRAAGDVVPLRRRRQRRRASPASTGWSTRCSTPGSAASTATSPTSTPAQGVLARVETGIGEPGDTGCLGGPGRLPLRAGTTWPTPRTARPPAARCSPTPRTARRRDQPPGRATSTAEEGDQRTSAAADASTRSTRSPPTWPRPTRASPSRELTGTDAGTLLDTARPAGAAALRAHRRDRRRSAADGGLDVTVNGVVARRRPGRRPSTSCGSTRDGSDGHLHGSRSRRRRHDRRPAGDRGEGRGGRRPARHRAPGVRRRAWTPSPRTSRTSSTPSTAGLRRATGDPGRPLFGFDPADPAARSRVAVTDPACSPPRATRSRAATSTAATPTGWPTPSADGRPTSAWSAASAPRSPRSAGWPPTSRRSPARSTAPASSSPASTSTRRW